MPFRDLFSSAVNSVLPVRKLSVLKTFLFILSILYFMSCAHIALDFKSILEVIASGTSSDCTSGKGGFDGVEELTCASE